MSKSLPEVFLVVGSLYCSRDSEVISTVLGSCVSVCLWDRRLAIGGINHFLLPRWNGEGMSSLKFGDVAIDALLGEMEALGSRRGDMVAKVFGGAAVQSLPGVGVGSSNVTQALGHLRHHGIEVVAERTGGTAGLRLRMFTASGEVRIWPIG